MCSVLAVSRYETEQETMCHVYGECLVPSPQEGISEAHRQAVEGRGREESKLRERVRQQQALLHDLTRDVVSMVREC